MGFDPVSMMAIAAVGGAVTAGGQMASGEANAANATYRAQVARNNAGVERQNASWESQAGETRFTTQGLKNRATVGSIKAAQAASGVDVNSGSSVDVSSASSELGQLDALTIRSNAARKAYGYQVAASNDVAQAQLYDAQASQAETAGEIGAIGTLLSTASSVGGKYEAWKTKGAPSATVG